MEKYSIDLNDLPTGYTAFYEKLREIEDGIYPCKKEGFFDFNTPGWVGVSRKNDNGKIELLWTSNEHYHVRHYSSHKAVMADFLEERVEYVMKAAFSMWPVKEQDDRMAVVLFLMNRMNNAIANMNQKSEEASFTRNMTLIKNYFQKTKGTIHAQH